LGLERFVMRVGVGGADHTAMEDRASAARRCAAMGGLAFVVRLGYLVWARPAFNGVYWAIATDLLHHGTFSIGGELTTDYEPLYPSFLVVCRLLVGSEPFFVQLLQVAFGSLCVL